MKTALILIGAILLAGVIAAGSFYGGMAYQTRQANQIRDNFMSARGFSDQGQSSYSPPSGSTGQFQQRGNGNFFGGGTAGEVKAVNGNVLTLSTAQEVTTVNLSDSTQIEKTVEGMISDLQPGMRVMVTGEREDNGDITANRISILGDNFPGAPETRFSPPPPEATAEP